METSYYFYHIQIKNGMRDLFAKFLRENGIYTTYRYYPLHRVPGYGVTGNFPNADYAADHTLNLPMHQTISDEELQNILEKIKEFDKQPPHEVSEPVIEMDSPVLNDENYILPPLDL